MIAGYVPAEWLVFVAFLNHQRVFLHGLQHFGRQLKQKRKQSTYLYFSVVFGMKKANWHYHCVGEFKIGLDFLSVNPLYERKFSS